MDSHLAGQRSNYFVATKILRQVFFRDLLPIVPLALLLFILVWPGSLLIAWKALPCLLEMLSASFLSLGSQLLLISSARTAVAVNRGLRAGNRPRNSRRATTLTVWVAVLWHEDTSREIFTRAPGINSGALYHRVTT